jgi:hypothetical protein
MRIYASQIYILLTYIYVRRRRKVMRQNCPSGGQRVVWTRQQQQVLEILTKPPATKSASMLLAKPLRS